MDQLELAALPPLSPRTERAFSEALGHLSDLDKYDEPAVVKLEATPLQKVRDAEATSLRMATPPPTAPRSQDKIDRMSPIDCVLDPFKDSAETKRARRSAIEKKSRQRRQEMLKRMREEVKQLENLYMEIVSGVGASSSNGGLASVSVDDLQHKNSELSLVAHALKEDQAALRELLRSHEDFHEKLSNLADEREARDSLWDSGIPPSSSFSVKFRLHSPEECYAIVRETLKEIERFCGADHFETTGATFMGWTDKRKVDRELQILQFCFTKRFPLESAESLLKKTWHIFSNGSKMAEMSFNRSVRTRFEVLQVLNDNLIIIRRDHKIPSIAMTFGSVQIIFRLRTPTGFTMCSRTIPAPEIEQAMEPHEHFYDVFHWTHFNQLHDELGNPAGCEIVAGGSVLDHNQLQSRYWLFELMCSVLRWENACVAPLLLKQL
ncbi:hypothetical protein PR003_g10623 [Phytophthora rubi]|uniref:BZIP domain-containing protein n=1 Tax=Phytophthora rubi TaxID=129364 RepID=A0A6A3M833_9STRA|nr:hypothetical protein PR002_g10401 [Phytophthora rubi]KAE9033184.1 hypothetical protein PR001_g10270 [Phytophthora rubi]KAE9340178.1 hypothetical protein PR003_g10623 [Phytophthora rubi]